METLIQRIVTTQRLLVDAQLFIWFVCLSECLMGHSVLKCELEIMMEIRKIKL